MCDPEGCATVLGVVRGGPPPSWLTQTLGVGGSGGQPPGSPGSPGGGGGAVGPQNDPHDMLIIVNMHKWGSKFLKKFLPINSGSHQPRSDLQVGSGSKYFFVFFTHF